METNAIVKRSLPAWLALTPFALLVLFYLPLLYGLVVDWSTDSNYSHGFLIPIVSAYLLWQKRKEIAAISHRFDNRGLIFVVLGLVLFILGNGAAEYFIGRSSFIVTLFGLVWYLYGRELVGRTWFEFCFLVFMVPIPYVIYYAATFPMQLLASQITTFSLNAIGMTVVRQGNIIHLPGYSLEVADACSGMRSLMSLLALGALFAYITQRRLSAQIILFASTIPIAVIANVFRVFVTSLLAYSVSKAVTEDPLHTLMGLSVFVVAFFMMFIEGMILKRIFK
jgi:exosortase